jgi:hypothetical protein
MSFSRNFQLYYSQADPIWPDGTFIMRIFNSVALIKILLSWVWFCKEFHVLLEWYIGLNCEKKKKTVFILSWVPFSRISEEFDFFSLEAVRGQRVFPSFLIYRVAAIFPEHFQSFTVALKNHIFTNYFTQNFFSSFLMRKHKQTDTFRQILIHRKLRELS